MRVEAREFYGRIPPMPVNRTLEKQEIRTRTIRGATLGGIGINN